MYDYDQIERIVMSVLQSSPDVFQQDGNVLKFKGDVIYNPNPNPGPKGDRGPQGESGEKGDKGPTGDKGDRGPQGINGKDGIVPNITGSASINGSSGTPSCTVTRTENAGSINFHFAFSGLKGDQGIQGVQGPKGDQGIQGPKGDRGIQGIQGVNGKNGKDGVDGVDASTSEIQTIINNVKNQIDDEIDRIESRIDTLDSDIQEKSQQIVSEVDWIKETFPNGSGSISNFGSQDVEEYLQMIAQWKDNSEARWSVISQTVNDITAEVNSIKQNGIDYESLVGKLYSYITGEETITTGMQSTWSRFLGLGENNIQLLEWIASGVKSQANSKEAIAELFASAKSNDSEAYSGLETRVSNIEGSYVASSNLSTMVKNEVNTSISGIFTENSSNSAVAGLYARLRTAEDKIDNMGGVSIETLANRVSATLFATDGQGTAAVRTAVNNAMSSVRISADQIENIGQVIINSINSTVGGGNTTVLGQGFINVSKVNTGLVRSQPNSPMYIACNDDFIITANIDSGDEEYDFIIGQENTGYYYTPDGSNGDRYGNFDNVKIKAKKTVDLHVTDSEKIIMEAGSATSKMSLTAGQIFCNGNIISSSDENLKNIKEYISPSIESIADVRLVNYELKSNVGYIRSGSIAQDWKDILPYAVSSIDEEQHLGLDYSSTALISAVTAAREIVKLKQENEQLKQRLSDLEDKINNFN